MNIVNIEDIRVGDTIAVEFVVTKIENGRVAVHEFPTCILWPIPSCIVAHRCGNGNVDEAVAAYERKRKLR